MKRSTALGLVAVVFLAGLAGGVLGARLLGFREPPAPVGHPGVPPGAPPLDRYFLPHDLELSAEQRQKMKELFERHRERFTELHLELRPRVESLMEEVDREVETILTPEQLERYRERPSRWRRGHRRHGPGPGRMPPPAERDPTADGSPPVD